MKKDYQGTKAVVKMELKLKRGKKCILDALIFKNWCMKRESGIGWGGLMELNSTGLTPEDLIDSEFTQVYFYVNDSPDSKYLKTKIRITGTNREGKLHFVNLLGSKLTLHKIRKRGALRMIRRD